MIAVHVPAGTPRTDELAMRVDSLTEIEVEKAADSTVTLTRRRLTAGTPLHSTDQTMRENGLCVNKNDETGCSLSRH